MQRWHDVNIQKVVKVLSNLKLNFAEILKRQGFFTNLQPKILTIQIKNNKKQKERTMKTNKETITKKREKIKKQVKK